jgi:hypothetical protein
MGGSKPPGPVSYVPKPTAPVTVQSVVPEKDFQRAESYISELKAEREATKARRNQMVGSASEIGQRMKEREAKTEAAYVSSLPAPEQIDTGRGITNIDDAAVVRDITSQIVNRRADQAGLRRPDGTKGVRTPAAPRIAKEAKAAPAPKPAPRPAPAPAPTKNKKTSESKKELSSKDIKNPFLALIDYQYHAKRGGKPDVSGSIERSNNPHKQDPGYFERITRGRGKPG